MLDVETLKKASSLMAKNSVPQRTVRTRKEARLMTDADPFGKVWMVGEKYYEVRTLDGNFGVRPNVALRGEPLAASPSRKQG